MTEGSQVNKNDSPCLCNHVVLTFILLTFSVKHLLESKPKGFAISNDELFCIFSKSSDLSVYNIEPFAFQRTMTVEGMKRPYYIVAGENVLYVSECEDKFIHRIQLPEGTVSNWSVNGSFFKLSISKNGNVIVAGLAKILEYTSVGTFVREIVVNQIDKNLFGLQHAIQLEGDKFLACHATARHHRVCMIDNTGRVIKCYGEEKGSGMGQLNEPVHLAIDRNGSILVAEHGNNRIVKLNSSLEYVNEFTRFKRPRRMLLNEELRQLYVAENNDRSITIHDM